MALLRVNEAGSCIFDLDFVTWENVENVLVHSYHTIEEFLRLLNWT